MPPASFKPSPNPLSPLLNMNPYGLVMSQWNNTSLIILGGISKNAQCSKTYTALCLRATAIQSMNNADFEICHIIHISDHKYESSVKSYNSDYRKSLWAKLPVVLPFHTGPTIHIFLRPRPFLLQIRKCPIQQMLYMSLINANVAFSVIWIYVKFNFQ